MPTTLKFTELLCLREPRNRPEDTPQRHDSSGMARSRLSRSQVSRSQVSRR